MNRPFSHTLIASLFIACFFGASVLAQTEEVDDMKLIEQIAQLQQQLDVDEIGKRDAAEKALIEIGVNALDYLEPLPDTASSDAIARLARVRIALETLAVKSVTQPQKIDITGEKSIAEILKVIKQKTGNEVQLFEGAPNELLSRKIDLKLKQASFWQVINALTETTNLDAAPFRSDRGILRLQPRSDADGPAMKTPPRDQSGIFQATVTQVFSSRNLVRPNMDYCTIRLRIRWEPRILPVAIALPSNSVSIVDEFDRAIKVSNPDQVLSSTVNADTPEIEFSLPLQAIDRQTETLKSFEAQLNTILPGRIEKFKFRNIGRIEPGSAQTKAGVKVGLEGIDKNEDLYSILVSVEFDDPKKGLESHLSWVYENKLWLENTDQKKMFPLATEVAGRTKTKITLKYFFAEDPSAMTMLYETPAAIVNVPVKIAIKDIPLP